MTLDTDRRSGEGDVVSDGIIDLTQYLQRRRGPAEGRPGGAFALWGADDERSRFALPLWRAVYLARGKRGGIVWRSAEDAPGDAPRPFVVLDLQHDPAELAFDPGYLEGFEGTRAPVLREKDGGHLTVFLGESETGSWYLVVEGEEGAEALGGRDREDLLFLAGECAGLLFLRNFARGAEADDEDP